MPTLDEPALRELMHHATADLHAPPAATRTATTGPRSRAPGVLVALGASGVAAAVVGLVVMGPGAAHVTPSSTTATGSHPATTSAQRVLYQLASVSERAPWPSAPSVAARSARAGVVRSSFTTAQLATLPTQTSRLRAALIAEAHRVTAIAAEEVAQARTDGSLAATVRKVLALSREIAAESPSEEVFTQAAGLLGDARTRPPVRAAVYDVLAVTPGVTVTDRAATPVTRSPGQASSDPTPLTGGDNRSEVEIRGLVSTGQSASIVVNGATGAVIELPPLLSQGLIGMPVVRVPPLTVSRSR